MADTVVPRQKGDEFQANFFWINACGLNIPETGISSVAWEQDGTHGFDDVVVSYTPEKNENGEKVASEFYQVKYHVDYSSSFTYKALMDPEFINNKTESILQRLYKNYLKDPSAFKQNRYCMVNTWTIAPEDPLKDLVNHGGKIILKKLMTGGERSKYGKIRKEWKDHLNITSDEELQEVLGSLKIEAGYSNTKLLRDVYTSKLLLAGLKSPKHTQISDNYTSLIQNLHGAKKTIFTRDELWTILTDEDLVEISNQKEEEQSFKIGIRSFGKGAENLGHFVDHLCCMLHCFNGRFLIDDYVDLKYLNEEINKTVSIAKSQKIPIELYFDTHIPLAFMLGRALNYKETPLNISVVQKTMNGNITWKPDIQTVGSYPKPLWSQTVIAKNESGNDLSVSVSISRNTLLEVDAYTDRYLLNVKSHLHFEILPNTGQNSIIDGNHAVAAMDDLVEQVRLYKKINSISGCVNLFFSGPVTMSFFLGQRAAVLNKLNIYDYDFTEDRDGGYHLIFSI